MPACLRLLVATIAVLLVQLMLNPAIAQSHSKYAGQEKRTIKSLSAKDLEELRRGGGWGLAKAAELNGVPGPAHLLEMKKQIALTAAQVAQITAIHQAMRNQAKALGKTFIDLERQLGSGFRDGSVSEETLAEQLQRISTVRGKLRNVHLLAHLKVRPILTTEQVEIYNRLRGYSQSDPCGSPPKGHDLAMWRKHNGCD